MANYPSPNRRAYASGNFLLTIDDEPFAPDPAYVKSIEGGATKLALIEEQMGSDQAHFKHGSTVEVEPFSFEVGVGTSKPILKWMMESFNKASSRRNGAITHADQNLESTLIQEFKRALITEIQFPKLDGSDKSPAYLKIKVQPEEVDLKTTGRQKLQSDTSPKQKLWTPANFAFQLDNGIDCRHVNKIEGFTIKQKTKQLYTGQARFPQLEPIGVEFPNLVLTMALAHAEAFVAWHRDVVISGKTHHQNKETTGAIDFMAPDAKTKIFGIDLFGVGIHSLSIEKSEANADSIKRARIELYVERMEFESPGASKGL